MPRSACGLATLRLGVATLMVAGAASVWELLALQAPGTPLYIGMLPGPIATLRALATALGVLLVLAGLTMPHASRGRAEPRRLVATLHVGTVLALGAQSYGAAHGMSGVQLGDLRADALPLFVVKHGSLLAVIGGLVALGGRMLAGAPELAGDPDGTAAARDGARPGPDRQLDPGKPDH